jgi:hypothetical protein
MEKKRQDAMKEQQKQRELETKQFLKKTKVPIKFKKKITSYIPFNILIKTLSEIGMDDIEFDLFHELLTPFTWNEEDTGCALRLFFELISTFVPQFRDEGDVSELHLKVIAFLRTVECYEFFGLLLQFSYWNIIHPVSRAVVKHYRNVYPERFQDTIKFQTHKFKRHYDDDIDSDTMSQSSNSHSISSSTVRSNRISIDGGLSIASETSLDANEKESLFVKLEQCMSNLNKKVGICCS